MASARLRIVPQRIVTRVNALFHMILPRRNDMRDLRIVPRDLRIVPRSLGFVATACHAREGEVPLIDQRGAYPST